jgi:tRNA 2-thiocytidine biosynthesis protein TtcA
MSTRHRAKIPYIEKRVRRLLGRAVQRYELIHSRDRILVALSGGVDSSALLWLLHDRLQRIPIPYEILAAHVDLGFRGEDYAAVESWVETLGIPHQVISSQFGPKAHSPKNRENPCFLCARLRRTALFRAARSLGCNKIAFGHNRDDLIETFLINILYGSQVATMLPRQDFFGGQITIIRPLALLNAETIRRFHRTRGLPAIANPCPTKHSGRRQEVRNMLQELYRRNRKIRGNIFHAMHNVNLDYLPSWPDA